MVNLFEIMALCKKFGPVTALDHVGLTVSEGEILGIAGESGSGKTTLARLMLKLINPTSGVIFYKGDDISSLSGADERAYRKEVQIVFQNPYTSLDPRMKVSDILDEPIIVNFKMSIRERDKKISSLLGMVGLGSDYLKKYPHELSGGERQRIGIARALAVGPKCLVLDEPISSLDVSIQAQVLNLLKDIKESMNLTYVFISHDLSVIRYFCDRVAVMKAGKIIEMNGSEELFSGPLTDYSKQLIDSIPKII